MIVHLIWLFNLELKENHAKKLFKTFQFIIKNAMNFVIAINVLLIRNHIISILYLTHVLMYVQVDTTRIAIIVSELNFVILLVIHAALPMMKRNVRHVNQHFYPLNIRISLHLENVKWQVWVMLNFYLQSTKIQLLKINNSKVSPIII